MRILIFYFFIVALCAIEASKFNVRTRDVIGDLIKQFPDGIVPYRFDSEFSPSEEALLITVMKNFEANGSATVKFVQQSSEKHYLLFKSSGDLEFVDENKRQKRSASKIAAYKRKKLKDSLPPIVYVAMNFDRMFSDENH